jgi:phosphotransacetylase/acyl dehydratase
MDCIENKTYDEIKVGDSAVLSRVLTKHDIQLFAVMSGDVNPAHLDEEYARSAMFHEIIAHGMWGGSLISTVIGTQLPGPGTIYLEQSLKFSKPVGVGDTINVRVSVKEKKQKNRIVLDCICEDQENDIVISGEALVIAPNDKVRRERIRLPRVEFKDSESENYRLLMALTKKLTPLKTAVVHPVDQVTLKGALEAADAGLIVPILVGPQKKIQAAAEELNADICAYDLVSTEHSHAAAERAVQLVHEGRAEALMKGKIHTQEFMSPIVDREKGLRTGRRISHVVALDVPSYLKPLFLTDVAINIQPDLKSKRDIVQNAIDLFLTLMDRTPKVAIVSAIETVDEKIQSTLDATALCKMAERGQIRGGILDGPLALDNAISRNSAELKGIISQVAGDADILVVPDVEAGNMLYKQMSYLSGIDGPGIVLGASVPIILTSRTSGPLVRIASSAMALVYARKKDKIRV